jgi:Raf kinase inhibitor-like YbhB/YbcL family protein
MLRCSAKKTQLTCRQICVVASVAGLALLLAGAAGCSKPATLAEGKPELRLTSSSFQQGKITKKFTCDGADVSPELAWAAPPLGTESFALIAMDRDTLFSSLTHWMFTHWVLYDIPPQQRELFEEVPKQVQLPDGSRQGQNDFDKAGYAGPCPHWTSHRYVFRLYALDSKLNLPAGATAKQVGSALQGHILAQGELVGFYHRQ